jgi:ATP-dependent DNA helicase RecG
MDLKELQTRIEQGEDLHTEFKEWPIHTDDLANSVIAFANTDGGQLVLGVAADGTIPGVPEPGAVMQVVDQVAYNNSRPPLTIVQETVTTGDGKTVIVVNVPKGDQRPYQTNKDLFYIRTTSGRRRAARQEILRLFQAQESFFYEETIVVRATLGDLDRSEFEHFVRQVYQRPLDEFGVSYEQMLRNIRLVREHEGILHPTVAALLFFGREPQLFLPQAYVVAARINGTDAALPPSDVKQINGTLPDVLENSARFLTLHLPVNHVIDGFKPERFPELPEVALREIVVNALAHRDYTVTGPVRVFIFDDRIEIRTPGGLPNAVTIEAIKLGTAHVLRNPTIYTLLSRLGLVTGTGTGVYRSLHLVRETTGKEASLYVEGNEFVVALPRRER